jgi:hypothetical protein
MSPFADTGKISVIMKNRIIFNIFSLILNLSKYVTSTVCSLVVGLLERKTFAAKFTGVGGLACQS